MIAPARRQAFQALLAIDRGRADLGDALARSRDALADERDRALTTTIVTGVQRHQAALDYQLARLSGRPLVRLDPEVLIALRMGAFQLIHLERVPPPAIVSDAVTLVRTAGKSSAAGLVNAVLRRLAAGRGTLEWPARPATPLSASTREAWVEYLAVVHSHPAWLVSRWLDRYGLAATEAWVRFDNETPRLTLAVNLARTTRQAAADSLRADGLETEVLTFAPGALAATSAALLTSDAFRRGLVLVQDEASQLVPLLVDVAPGSRVLDLCAAPGGKTVALAAAAGEAGRVIATDVRPKRMRVLAATLERAGAIRATPVQVGADGPLPFPEASFDRVLVDAPCSGLGTLRRDPDIRWRRAEADLPALAAAQAALLERAAPLVRPGGRLVYSTCSSEPDENEAVVAGFLARHPEFDAVPLGAQPTLPDRVRALATPEGWLRTYPHRDGLEAFFGAVLARKL
ncbi:MAG: 16S rRNA (cytosine(967)-C(5))-methyltransferase RsmB [Vicinamibacterales bacterium]